MNGDGFDDVIVGAPLYSNYANTDGKYETGRVYIAYQSERDSFQSLTLLDGDVTKARFGLSVAALGDINLDGYNDIAVGAPYDGPNERGAVHIFHGSADGIKIKATQVQYVCMLISLSNSTWVSGARLLIIEFDSRMKYNTFNSVLYNIQSLV